LSNVFNEMQGLRRQLAEVNGTLVEPVEGSAASGKVRVKVSGDYFFERVQIDPELLAGDDVSILEDLLVAALRDAVAQLTASREKAMGAAISAALAGNLPNIAAIEELAQNFFPSKDTEED
jgi:nucleoid-associated protein EbfC